MKEKKGNLKHIGIKITSYLQKLMDREDLNETEEAMSLRVIIEMIEKKNHEI